VTIQDTAFLFAIVSNSLEGKQHINELYQQNIPQIISLFLILD